MPTRSGFMTPGSGALDLYKLGLVIGGNRREVIYVNPNAPGGNDGRTWDSAYTTMAKALANVQSNGIIMFIGKIREQCTAPDNIFDVTIIGCGNRPRHPDLVATGYEDRSQTGAAWVAPASPTATTPLLKLRHQGWTLANFLMQGHTDAECVYLERNALSGASEYDPSHAAFVGMRFVGGVTGIRDAGGCYNVLVEYCTFRGITDGTGRAIWCSSTAVANPLEWIVRYNYFGANDNHIVAAASGWYVHDNILKAPSVTSKIDFTGGVATNVVTRNFLGGTYSIGGGYTGAGAADEWYGNWGSTSPTVSDPA